MVLNEAEGVQYELFDISDLHEMAAMTAETFAQYEPVTSSLGISLDDFADFVRLRWPKVEQEELTVIARNQDTNQIIGAMVTDDFAVEPPEEMRHLGDNFEPLWAVLDKLDSQYKQGRILSKGEYLHFLLLAVDHRQTGKNVAKNLVQTCLEHGVRKGYKTGVVEATGVVSQHIFRKFGFVDRFEAPYKTFTFQGRQVFESIEGHRGIILMDKALIQ
jgi:predicted N-acetyltransferase YhbS